MRFRVTSIVDPAVGAMVSATTTRIEDWLAAALSDGELGSSLHQFTIVVVAVDDDPSKNAKYGSDRLETLTIMPPGERRRNLRVAIYISPAEMAAISEQVRFEKIAALATAKLRVRPKRIPKGFDYRRCAASMQAALRVNELEAT
jgi:hypothetical protein